MIEAKIGSDWLVQRRPANGEWLEAGGGSFSY